MLTVLAREQYRYAVYGSPWPYEIPTKGMGIGQQLGWLTAARSRAELGSSVTDSLTGRP
ncbi:hypothetical protein ACFVTE_14305 [Arthrobacter sp. NPDC058097]|uniref:hypothetical protein n=1 Tax=Arthrobacter sp. NPDC058097 TaxID=3346340 RepID=UPI0036D870CE